MRRAIGELLTCTRCIGTWAAAGVVGLHIRWRRASAGC